jgi:hypothetical protein
MYVCIYVGMYVRTLYMYAGMYVDTYICMYVRIRYTCVFMCMYYVYVLCMHVFSVHFIYICM